MNPLRPAPSQRGLARVSESASEAAAKKTSNTGFAAGPKKSPRSSPGTVNVTMKQGAPTRLPSSRPTHCAVASLPHCGQERWLQGMAGDFARLHRKQLTLNSRYGHHQRSPMSRRLWSITSWLPARSLRTISTVICDASYWRQQSDPNRFPSASATFAASTFIASRIIFSFPPRGGGLGQTAQPSGCRARRGALDPFAVKAEHQP